MNTTTTADTRTGKPSHGKRVGLKTLMGSADRIGRFLLPFLLVGLAVQLLWPSLLSTGDQSAALKTLVMTTLGVGVVIWAWSVFLILTRVPRGELITTGPFALVKHPLYTAVGLLVLPSLGLLLGSWLGAFIGVALYIGTRRYAPEEERGLAQAFGPEWDAYTKKVLLPWL